MKINKSELKKAGIALGLATTLWTYAGNQWKSADAHFSTPQLQQAEELRYNASRLERATLSDALVARENVTTPTLVYMITKDLNNAKAMREKADALVPRETYDVAHGKYMSNVVMGGFSYLGSMCAGIAGGLFLVNGLTGRNRYDRIFEKKKEPKSVPYKN